MIEPNEKLVRDPGNIEQNAPESPAKPTADTSGRGTSFKKHCLRCRKFSDSGACDNHRHTPAKFNTPCEFPGCRCTYFYSWENLARKFKKPLADLRREKEPEQFNP